jgi:ABC-2 type transport system ATP-binding protein
MSRDVIIETRNLTKVYRDFWGRPKVQALKALDLQVYRGEIFGLLGPNGSGKSTILRILTGYLPASAGSVRIGGIEVAEDPLAARKLVGYLAEDAPLYDGMRVGEFLRFMAEIKGAFGKAGRRAVGAACERLHLESVFGMPIGKLSRGYRQRVAIAQALLLDPPILLLDEPTNALDAYQVIGIRELIRSFAGARSVLVASHVLTEIEKVATRVMILREGALLTADAMAEAAHPSHIRLGVAGPGEAVLEVLRQVPGVVRAEIDPGAAARASVRRYRVEGATGGLAEKLSSAVIGHGFALAELTEEKPDLESVFLALTRRADPMLAA